MKHDRAAFGLALFSLGLDIPEDQQQMCLDLSQPFWLQTALTNDYHSWERERDMAGDNGAITNAIWVLMNRHAMTLEEAQSVCRAKAKEYTAEYLAVLEKVKTRDDLGHGAKQFLDMLRFGISGNAVWSVRCPRYHVNEELSAAQLEMRDAIWAEEDTVWEHPQVKTAIKAAAESAAVEAKSVEVEAKSPEAKSVEVEAKSPGVETGVVVTKLVPALPVEVCVHHAAPRQLPELTRCLK